jgi:hypothetical protein
MSGEYQLLLMIAVMHVLGLACVGVLVMLALRDGDEGHSGSEGSGSDDGWGNEPRRPPQPSDRPWGGIPLPDAKQSRVRLRDHRKLADLLPRRTRRPAREPVRTPVRIPQ